MMRRLRSRGRTLERLAVQCDPQMPPRRLVTPPPPSPLSYNEHFLAGLAQLLRQNADTSQAGITELSYKKFKNMGLLSSRAPPIHSLLRNGSDLWRLSSDWSRREDIQARTVRGRLSWIGRRYLAGTVRGRLNWFWSLLPEVQGTSSWFISWMLEQHEDQEQSMKSSSSTESRPELKRRMLNAVIECRSDCQWCILYLAERPAEGPVGRSARTRDLLQREERLDLGAHLGRERICMLLVKDKPAVQNPQEQIVKKEHSSKDDEGQLERRSADKSKLEELLKSGCKQEEKERALNRLKRQPARTRPALCRTDR
ncbi:hypothetical protein F511_28234 [Dorcoceras hygrometricum]|uniref:Uncharacterized protein n=1 Tax=Dorcoceras hygrometricum TaxID=472368 RepID=A0A2Z7AVB6_9LAMI|nr:hypothetical protein F511_28234 [Dorcoceras hygrometricum]